VTCRLRTRLLYHETELAKLEPKVKDPTKIKMAKEEFLNLANTASDKMRAGSPVEKDILARKMLLNLTLDNKKPLPLSGKSPLPRCLLTPNLLLVHQTLMRLNC